ncbi:MAG: epimerase [Syntrophus sp. (in: bacteria)]|nr:epimerase [Syntrophus sp. (in: bacteria)]
MKIAVTGASGFIGRHVLAELARTQAEIVAVTRDPRHLQNLSTRMHVVEMDISLPGIDCFAQMGHPDALIHLAWDGLPNYKSLHHFEMELPRHYHFLKTMIKAGLTSLLVTGTCFEYGMQSGALSEDTPTLPVNAYGFAKDRLRKQLEFLSCEYTFSMIWARLFYTYGEGQSAASLYQQLLAAESRGDKSFDMSGGEQLRDYLPVANVAQMIVKLALSQVNAGVVNICSGQPISVRRLVEGWIRENRWNISMNLGRYPYPDYEPMVFWGDRQRLDSILGK